MMEQHKDSALMMLAGYDLPCNSSQYDITQYNLPLTYARYKNFIDTKENSIINAERRVLSENDCNCIIPLSKVIFMVFHKKTPIRIRQSSTTYRSWHNRP